MMKRRVILFTLVFLLLSSLACQTLSPPRLAALVPLQATATAETLHPATPSATSISGLVPTPSATIALASPGTAIAPPAASVPAPLPAEGYAVRLHPEDGLYAGDLVSFEVISPPGIDLSEQNLRVQAGDQELGPVKFGPFGIGGRAQATLLWSWDTSGLKPGPQKLTFSIEPAGITWSQTVELHPAAAVPPPAPAAHWVMAESDCCVVHYVTGTAAARDINTILPILDAQASKAISKLGIDFTDPIEMVLLPRVLGQGGFANEEIAISYLDRNYAGNNFAQVALHEMIHILDRRLGGDYMPSMFVEGLAVYVGGGHYKPEPLLSGAVALPRLGLYLPLAGLANDFYQSQHEIGYLEAGSLVQYMVQTWGWDKFNSFYRHIPAPKGGQQPVDVINIGLQRTYGLNLDELESRFLADLEQQPVNPDLEQDVRLNVDLYDTIRRYQQDLDPSAYFLTAWLLNGPDMRKRGIVADYLRHPDTAENQSLESLLAYASESLFAGRYPETQRTLNAVNTVLAFLERSLNGRLPLQSDSAQSLGTAADRAFSGDSLAMDILALARTAQSRGYELQKVVPGDGLAQVWVTAPGSTSGNSAGPPLVEFDGEIMGDSWQLQQGN
jgi:hypothetical protein